MKNDIKLDSYELSWYDSDIERILSLGIFAPQLYTNVNSFISLIVGSIICAIIYYSLILMTNMNIPFVEVILSRLESGGIISYITLFFFSWGLAILLIKRSKIKLQRKALQLSILPQDANFVINQSTSIEILKRLRNIVDNPKNFILLNKIELAISNLKNIGNIGDVASIISVQEKKDMDTIESSYWLINTQMWIIPILGFIGTVLGLGVAISGFSDTVKSSTDISVIKESITGITGGLGTAFDTTLVSLVLVVILQFLTSVMQSKEMKFLEECSSYCQQNILSKLKIDKSLDEK